MLDVGHDSWVYSGKTQTVLIVWRGLGHDWEDDQEAVGWVELGAM